MLVNRIVTALVVGVMAFFSRKFADQHETGLAIFAAAMALMVSVSFLVAASHQNDPED